MTQILSYYRSIEICNSKARVQYIGRHFELQYSYGKHSFVTNVYSFYFVLIVEEGGKKRHYFLDVGMILA
jgi:hypothetical protein